MAARQCTPLRNTPTLTRNGHSEAESGCSEAESSRSEAESSRSEAESSRSEAESGDRPQSPPNSKYYHVIYVSNIYYDSKFLYSNEY